MDPSHEPSNLKCNITQISDKLRAFTDAINDALKRGDVEEMKRLAAMIDPTPSPEDRAEDRT